jgi:hypothetical protein
MFSARNNRAVDQFHGIADLLSAPLADMLIPSSASASTWAEGNLAPTNVATSKDHRFLSKSRLRSGCISSQ